MTVLKVALFCLIATLQVVYSQVTPSVQQHLLNLANKEITKQLVNGSDDKNANQSAQTQKSLASIVQAGQIVSFLSSESPSNQAICKWLQDAELDKYASTQAIYYKAEALSLFKCSQSKFSETVNAALKSLSSNPESHLTTVDDFYYGYLINQKAKTFGVSDSTKLKGAIETQVTKKWIPTFQTDKFSLKGQELSMDSFKILEIMSGSPAAAQQVQKALKSLVDNAGSTSQDTLSENRIFFIAPKAAHSQKNFDLTGSNLHTLKAMMTYKNLNSWNENMSNFKNYFTTKVIGHSSVSSIKCALEALEILKNQVYLVNGGDGYLLVDTKIIDTLKFEVKNYLGQKDSVASLQSASMYQMDDTSNTQDLTSKFTVTDEGSVLQVKFDDVENMKWASYAIKFELKKKGLEDEVFYVTKTFQVKTKIYEVVSTSFAQTAGWDYPEKYQVNQGFPVEFEYFDASDYPIVHIQIDAQFFGDKDKIQYPQTLYITLQKDNQIPYSAHSDYISSIKRYQIDFDLRYAIKPAINGDYKVILHVEDSRAVNQITQDLGVLSINFNDGSIEATNFGVRDDFKLLDKITNYFPPEEEPKGAFIPLVFSGILAFIFLKFVGSLYGNGANLSNVSFSGLIFATNYLLILAIIVAFWLKINLVNTLWILAALTPVTLFTMNKGLTPENCHISGFEKKDERQGKGKSKNH